MLVLPLTVKLTPPPGSPEVNYERSVVLPIGRDLAVVSYDEASLHWYSNMLDSPAVPSFLGSTLGNFGVIRDVDGDGLPDIVSTSSWGIVWFRNQTSVSHPRHDGSTAAIFLVLFVFILFYCFCFDTGHHKPKLRHSQG